MKTGNIFIVFFFLFMRISFSYAQTENGNSILIEHVPFNEVTFAKISCEKFEISFGNRAKSKTVDNDAAAEKLILFLQGIKYIKKNREIDVRAKFIFLENNTPVIICTDGFEIQVNGRLIKRNEKFTNFLKNLIRGD